MKGRLLLAPFVGLAAGRPVMLDSWPKPRKQAEPPGGLVSARYVTQPQDHFDKSNTKVWQQAYFVNDTFWEKGSSSPVFLCVGGEGPPMDGSAVVDSAHCNIAVEWLQETGALMFALEHRYYGCHNMSACPVDDFNSPQAMRHLSSRQAIEDIAGFVRQMRAAYSLGVSNRWVTWGGSYPGMLAGWSRLKHPELIHAAVASSAPVHAKFDMNEYNDAVRRAYTVSDNGVGGSAACAQAIREGHRTIEEMLANKGPRAVEGALGMQNGTLEGVEAQRAQLGSGVAIFPAQSNDLTCSDPVPCEIKGICEVMTNASLGSPLQRLIALRKAQGIAADGPALQAAVGVPDYWFWQTCTEFGFYQSCDEGSDCPFVRGLVSAASEAEGCADYNISVADVKRNIQATNEHYGALATIGAPECVLWPNGEVDPWAPLGVLQSPSLGQPTLWVQGASHHAWTHPSAPTDQRSVVEARHVIRQTVSQFLRTSCSQDFDMPAVLI